MTIRTGAPIRSGTRAPRCSASSPAREAWRDAGLRAGEPGAGVLIGSGGGGIDVGEKQYEDFFTTGGRHVTPYAIAVGICGMVSSEISISLGLRGMSHVLSCGCTSSTDAIGYAASLIRSGEYDVILSGGTDGCVLPGMIFGFSRMRAVSTQLQRSSGRGVASLRSRARRLRARRRRLDAGARARRARARARCAASTRASKATPRPATPITACRWIRTAWRSSAASRRRSCRARPAPGRDRLHQLPRHVDAAERRHRVAVRPPRVRPSRRSRARIVDQVDDRPSAGRERRRRRRRDRAGHDARCAAADDQPRRSRSGVRHGLHSQHSRAPADVDAALCNCLGFGSKNSALVLGRAR